MAVARASQLSAEAEKSDIDGLLQLVQSHQRQHEDSAYDSAAPVAIQRCKTMLTKLRKLLPRLMRPIASLPATAAVPVLQNLCDLLQRLLSGRVCPHSMMLFVEGRAQITTATGTGTSNDDNNRVDDSTGASTLGSPSYTTLFTMLLYMVSFYTNVTLQNAQRHVLDAALQMVQLLQRSDVYAFVHFFQDAVRLLEDAFLLEEYLKNHDGIDLRAGASVSCFLDTAVHIYQNADGPLRPKSPATLCGCMPIDNSQERHERINQLKQLLPHIRVDSYATALALRRSTAELVRQVTRRHYDLIENDRAFDRLCQLAELFIEKDEALLRGHAGNTSSGRRSDGLSRRNVVDVVRGSKLLLESVLHASNGFDSRFAGLTRAYCEQTISSNDWPELAAANAAVLERIREGYARHANTVAGVLWPSIEKFLSDTFCQRARAAGGRGSGVQEEYWKPIIGIIRLQLQRQESPPIELLANLLSSTDVAMFDAEAVGDTVDCVHRALSGRSVLHQVSRSLSKALTSAGQISLAVIRTAYNSSRKRKRDWTLGAGEASHLSPDELSDRPNHRHEAIDPCKKIGDWLARLVSFPSDSDDGNILQLSFAMQILLPLKDIMSSVSRLETSTISRTLFQRVEDVMKTLGPPLREVTNAYVSLWIVLLFHLDDRELSKYQGLMEKVLESIERQSYFHSAAGDRKTCTILEGHSASSITAAELIQVCSSGYRKSVLSSRAQNIDDIVKGNLALRRMLVKSAAFRSTFLVQYTWSRPIPLKVSPGSTWRMAFPWKVVCRSLQQASFPDAIVCTMIEVMPILAYLLISEGIASAKEVVASILEVLNSKFQRTSSQEVRSAIVAACGTLVCTAAAGESANEDDEAVAAPKSKISSIAECCQQDQSSGTKLALRLSLFESVLGASNVGSSQERLQLSAIDVIAKIFRHCALDDENEALGGRLLQFVMEGLASAYESVRHLTSQLLVGHPALCEALFNPVWEGSSKTFEHLDAVINKAQADSNADALLSSMFVLGTLGRHCGLRNVEIPDGCLWILLRLTSLWTKFEKLKLAHYATAAHDQIQSIMAHHKTSWRRLCVEFPELCYVPLVDELLLLGMVRQFLRTFMGETVNASIFLGASAPFVLPKYIVNQNEQMLHAFMEEHSAPSRDAVEPSNRPSESTNGSQAKDLSEILHTHLEHVLKELIMHQSDAVDKENALAEWEFLFKLLPENLTIHDLITHASLRLQNSLAWELGGSRHRIAKRAFREVTRYLHESNASGDGDSNSCLESGDIVMPREHFLALMTDLGTKVSGKEYTASSTATKIRAIKSIDRLLELLTGSSHEPERSIGVVDPFVPKIMATLKIGLADSKLKEHAIHAWSTFLRMLSTKALEGNLCSIVVSLLPCLGYDASSMLLEAKPGGVTHAWNIDMLPKSASKPRQPSAVSPSATAATADTRTKSAMDTAVSLLKYLFIEKRDALKQAFPKISLLPSIPELDEVFTVIVAEVGDPSERSLHQYLVDMVSYINHWDAAVREVALAQLFRCLVLRSPELQRLMQNEADLFIDSAIGDIVLSVIKVARTDGGESIKLLCARCLGALGAIDSARMPLSVFMPSSGRTSINSKSSSHRHVECSTKTLACVLIESMLVTELRAAPENTDSVAFAIQELLKFLAELTVDQQHSGQSIASLNAEPTMSLTSESRAAAGGRSVMPDWMKRRFERKNVLQIIEPYWSTKYSLASNIDRAGLHPALDDITYYEKYGTSYEEWLLAWCRRLIHISQPPERKIFIACRTALSTCPQIARFLLPYLIQNVLRSGRAEVYQEIKREVMTILNDRDDGVVLDDVMMLQDDESVDTLDDSLTRTASVQESSKAAERPAFGEHSSRHHQCCQVIFSTLDELNDWIWTNEKKRLPSSSSSASSIRHGSIRLTENLTSELDDQEKENLEEFLKDIPSQSLSNAAYRIKAYARAIQYFEVYLRQQRATQSGPLGFVFVGPIGPVPLALVAKSALYLQQLYKSVDEPDALIGLATLRRLYDAYSHTDNTLTASRGNTDALNLTDLMHQIVDHEQLAQWEDALACYEQAVQEIQSAYPPSRGDFNSFDHSIMQAMPMEILGDGTAPHRHPSMLKPELYAGMIGCLIQLGRLESALQHIYGIVTQEPQFKGTLYPYALECSWRLSRWELLSELLGAERQNPLLASLTSSSRANGSGYGDLRVRRVDVSQLMLVRVLHSLHTGDTDAFVRNVNDARLEIMGPLSAASAESYQRAYPLLHKLHFLHEAEQGFIFLHSRRRQRLHDSEGWDDAMDVDDGGNGADDQDGNGMNVRSARWKAHVGVMWETRYELLAPSLKYRDPLLALRRVLLSEAGLHNDVSRNWLQYAKLTRKEGYLRASNSAVMHAEVLDNQYAQMERAKLLVRQDRMHEALQILEPVDINPARLDYDVEDPRYCAKNLLLATNWMQESGQRQGQQVVERYEAVIKFDPTWEKGYFFLARYYEYLLNVKRRELSERAGSSASGAASGEPSATPVVDADIHAYLIRLMENYVHALRHGTKFVFQSLPRLLTLWFEYGELLYARASASSEDDAQARKEKRVLSDMAGVIKDAARTLPAYEWLMCFPQVASRVCHPNPVVVKSVTMILTRVLVAYPTQAMWLVLGLSRSLNAQRKFQAQSVLAETERAFTAMGQQDLATSFEEGGVLVDELIRLAGHDPQHQRKIHIRLSRLRSKILVPIQSAMTTLLPRSGLAPSDTEHSAFAPSSQVHIRAFTDTADVMMTKEKPKRIEIVGSDGRWYPFLCKREKTGDLRKDARMMEFNVLINKLLQKDREGRKRKLRLRTYAVVCLNEESGLMEWVEHTRAMRQLVAQIRKTERGYLPPVRLSQETKERYLAMQRKYAADPHAMATYYRRKILALPEFMPRFHQWFYNNFPDPTAWFEARRSFARSAALWSMVGHVIGLGDRHGENILIDTTTGECVHVDFDCLFDKGLKLAKPEIVPFRLTPNLIDAFGITGVEGVFRKVAEVTMHLLRNNQATLRSVLESFIHDPLVEWGRRGKATQRETPGSGDRGGVGAGGAGAKQPAGAEQGNAEAHAILAALDDRLRGVYNLGAAIRPQLSASHLRLLPAHESLPLSVQGQVDKLIQEATSLENLAQMYIGWMPFL